MPAIPLPLALIQLWIADPALPWSNPVWQSLTHVPGDPWAYDHGGRVTAAGTNVAEWTVAKAQAVETFMNNCKTAEDPAEHYAVKWKDNDHEGRSAWNAWVKTSWVKWKINKLVDHILQESGCEPHDVMARMNCKTADDFPTMEAAQVKQAVSVKLADALFGDDAFTVGSFVMPTIMTFITMVLVLTWSRYRKVIKRQANSIEKKAREVEEQWLAMAAANSKPTLASIRTYLKKLESLVTLLGVFKDQETAERLDARREQVSAMLAASKKDPTKAESIARLPKALREALDKLATEKEVKELELLIETTLAAMVPSEDDEVVIDFKDNIDLSDWKSGVEEYDQCSENDLWEHLGLSDKKLPFFQTRSDPDAAIDPWSEEGQLWLDNPTSPAQILSPRWHQLVGILRLIDRVLNGEPVMLMDGVGVGKTMQAVGLIACLAHYREHYRKHGKFPGKFAQRSYKKTGGNIPDLPAVIMSPPNLQHQWMSEIQRYLRRATFDVLPYTGKYTARTQWWTVAWSKCQQPPIRRIILATTNAAHDDAATVFIDGDRDSYGQPMASPRFERTSPNTLFGREYNVTFFDEAHCARKYNKVHVAARGLQERSHSMVAMTATPVTTKPTDLWIMGQLLGLQRFKDTAQLKAMNRELAAAQRRDRKAQREAGVEGSILRAVFVGNHNPDAAAEEYLPAMKQWMGRMRGWFSPAIILRTLDSTDNTGKKILGLPPYHDHSLKIKLLDWEMDNLRGIARGYLDDCPIVGMSKNFYVEFRRSILHPHMNPTEERSWTKPKSLEEWQTSPDTKSMKLDVLAKLIQYHLESDGRQPLMMDESGRTLVPNPAFTAGNTSPDEPDRIVVFSAFVTSNQAIVDILDLHGIHALELNGQTPMRKRKGILDEFRSSTRPKGTRVLILSGVGMVGLNLACANIMLVMDTLWSEQDDRQLRGRIYRHPQAKEVHIYRAIALKTADVFLNNISFSKGAMHDEFVGAPKEFRGIFDGDDGTMGDLISVGLSKDDSTDDGEPMDVDPDLVGRKKTGKKKAYTKGTTKTTLARPATKRKVKVKDKGSKEMPMAVDTDDESESTSHKRRKDMQLLSPGIISEEAARTTSKSIVPLQLGGGIASFSVPSVPKVNPAVIEFRDDQNNSSLSKSPSRSPQPSSPSHPPPPSSSSSSSPSPRSHTHHPPTARSPTPDAQLAGVQDGHLRCSTEEASTAPDSEMDWNDSGSHDWNDGGGHDSHLTVEHKEQHPPHVHRASSFYDTFSKRNSASMSSSARAAVSRGQSDAPRPRPRPLKFNPAPFGAGPVHSAKFSSNDRMQRQRSCK